MSEMKGEVWFLASCVEFYKDEKGLSGQEAYDYLRKTGAVDFIIECWEGLHMTSPEHVIDSIDEYIETHSKYQSVAEENGPMEKRKNDNNKIGWAVACVNEFAKRSELSPKDAFRVLYANGGISFLDEHFEAEHLLSFDEAVDDLLYLCKRKAGAL